MGPELWGLNLCAYDLDGLDPDCVTHPFNRLYRFEHVEQFLTVPDQNICLQVDAELSYGLCNPEYLLTLQ